MFPLVALAPITMTAIEAFTAGVGVGITLHKAVKGSSQEDDEEEGDKK